MHVSSENSNTRGSGRLSVFFEQDLFDDANGDSNNNNNNISKSERVDIRGVANASLESIDTNNNTHNDSSILSSELNDSSEPPPVMRRHKSDGRHHSRERGFVNAAARSVARSIKRMSLIESSSNNNNSNSSGSGSFCNLRDRTAQESGSQDGGDHLKANAKHKQHYNSTPSLPQSYSGAPLQPSGSAHSLGSSPNPSPRSNQSKAGNGGGGGLTAGVKGLSTAKHDQQTSAAAAAAISSTSAAAGTSGHHHSVVVASTASASATTGATAATATPPEKEKKRKEVSSSRVKKFHRHFSQVSKDEKLINYFSCALVGDIPLQGHLYITEQHFAFYSNVFGYVTKVVIPTSSVTKISKEKTAKIIPNAVGVATADERHVFGSFISREAAFRLMCTVCTQLATGNEILPKPLPVDVELPEEYLLDDDSSCSISGNESPPHLRSAAAAAAAAATEQQEMQLRQRNISDRHSDLPGKSTLGVANELDQVTIRSSAPPVVHYEEQTQQTFVAAAAAVPQLSTSALPSNTITATTTAATPVRVLTANATATTTASASTTSSLRSRLSRKLPTLTELHVLYLGIMLAIMLALFSVFLLYRILDIEAKTHLYNTPVDFNLRSGNDDDIFADALRWQKELQDKSTAEAQHILSKNLEQISKVRRSLETLSMLIHDRRAGYVQPETATQMQMQMQMDVEATDGGSSTISSTSSAIPID
ncbi:hypothetical protein KR215_003441 [Drosophila sulfurigaster]|nr:hypothetical protein KR215_003441 [Drosophila sulfurigaster]